MPSAPPAPEYFLWKNRDHFDSLVAIEVEKIARARYRYFKAIRDFSEEVGTPWEHLDLFRYRNTSQVRMRGLLDSRPDFANGMLAVFDRHLELAKPGLILVAQAAASKILYERYSPRFSDRRGFHFTKVGSREVPTFFCSMLSGQRALDTHSRERLFGHCKQALRKAK